MTSRWTRYAGLSLLAATLSLAGASMAKAQTFCGDNIKQAIAKELAFNESQKDPTSKEALAFQKQIYAKYSYCATNSGIVPVDKREFCSPVTYVGSLFYERMSCCGYDPQKRTFACPIRIEKPFGFGAAFSGSREWVLSCVNFGNGFVPVALDDVHLSNAVPAGGRPPWMFAVTAQATRALSFLPLLPLNGQVYRARSILSWNLVPTSCEYKSIWGNTLDYQIRLDP